MTKYLIKLWAQSDDSLSKNKGKHFKTLRNVKVKNFPKFLSSTLSLAGTQWDFYLTYTARTYH